MSTKKTYFIPTIEVIAVETERMMDFAGASDPDHSYGAPSKREPAF